MSYPKKYVSPDGAPVLAKQAVHEAELVAQGYTLAAAEPPSAPAAPEPCAKCAELEAEVAKLKAQLAKVKEPKATTAAAKAKA